MASKEILIKLANLEDVPPGKAIVVLAPEGREVALFNVNGQIYALDNACPHMGGPLGEGEIEDGRVTCPWHAWQFDIRTGCCENMPGYDALSLPIEMKNGEIFLLHQAERL